MKSGRVRLALLVLVVLLSRQTGESCTWAVGYFYQVTAIRGTIVGADYRKIPFLPNWKWARQRIRKFANVAIYKYQSQGWTDDRAAIASTKTDANGWFELKDVKSGHYSLNVRDGELGDWFDVEVTEKAKPTDFVKIDISPVFPDCTGGHEFEMHTVTKQN